MYDVDRQQFSGNRTAADPVQYENATELTAVPLDVYTAVMNCAAYAHELPRLFGTDWDDSQDLDEIADQLTEYIRQKLEL